MFPDTLPAYLCFPVFLLLVCLNCHCASTEEAAKIPFGQGELYAVTGDTACRPSKASGCDKGAVVTWSADSVSYYYPVEKLYTTHAYSRIGDTLLVGVRKQRLVLRESGKNITLTDPVRHRIFTLSKIADAAPADKAPLSLDGASMELSMKGYDMLIHPPMECAVNSAEGYPLFVLEQITGDSAQFTDVLGIRRVTLPGHELLDLSELGLLYRYGKQPDRGAYRLINGIGQIASGLLSLDVPYFQTVDHDLRGVWNSSTAVSLTTLQDANQKGLSARLGLRRDKHDRTSADPLTQLSPDSTYRFGLEIDEQYVLYLTVNGIRVSQFPSVYRSTGDERLILAENSSCELLALEADSRGEALALQLQVNFIGEPEGRRYPVTLEFHRP